MVRAAAPPAGKQAQVQGDVLYRNKKLLPRKTSVHKMLNFPFALQSMFACFSFVYDFDYNAILVFCSPFADKYSKYRTQGANE